MSMTLRNLIYTAPFLQEMIEATANLYRLGWDERNGGNISYLLNEYGFKMRCYLELFPSPSDWKYFLIL